MINKDIMREAYNFIKEKFPYMITFNFDELDYKEYKSQLHVTKNYDFSLGNITDMNNLIDIYKRRESFAKNEQEREFLSKVNEFLSKKSVQNNILWLSTILCEDTIETVFFNLEGDLVHDSQPIDRDMYLQEMKKVDQY